MTQQGLEQFGAASMFDLVVKDMEALKTNPLCYRLVSQQIGSADSIWRTSKRVMEDSAE